MNIKQLHQQKSHNGKETAIKMTSILKAELECKQDLTVQEELETGKIFSDLLAL